MGKPSVVYQVKEALKTIFDPGTSRHELKGQGLEGERITGIRTMQDYVKSCSRFACWCKEHYNVRDIRCITPTMAETYVAELCDKELSGGYIGRAKAAIRKLDVAMRHKGDCPRDAPPLLEPGGGWHSDRRPERAYTPDEAEQIIADIRRHARDKQTANVARLQSVAGLRISEAVMIRGEDIDVENRIIHVRHGTKGGRPREVQVELLHRAFLQELKVSAEQNRDGHVFQGRGNQGTSLAKRTASAVHQACQRLGIEHCGTHGFRRGWAQERYCELQRQDHDDCRARRSVAKELGHNRIDVTYSYIPR
jgi:integrase